VPFLSGKAASVESRGGFPLARDAANRLKVLKMEYREADFDVDVRHFAVSHRLTGAVFVFDGYPDPSAATKVNVSFPEHVDDSELEVMCSAAGLCLKAHIDRTRS
jgi:hypothetical protein